MTVDRAAQLLVCLGAIGVLQFGCLVFAVRQLQADHVSTVRLDRRMDSFAVRHASLWTVLAGVVLVAGSVLWVSR